DKIVCGIRISKAPPNNSAIGTAPELTTLWWNAVSHGIRLAISSLVLCFASSAGAQGSLEAGKTAAQLYAANCTSCHQSPHSVTTATVIFGLESYLREHYTPNRQSAAAITAYLEGLETQSSGSVRARGPKQSSQANAPKPSPSETKEDKSAVARALN